MISKTIQFFFQFGDFRLMRYIKKKLIMIKKILYVENVLVEAIEGQRPHFTYVHTKTSMNSGAFNTNDTTDINGNPVRIYTRKDVINACLVYWLGLKKKEQCVISKINLFELQITTQSKTRAKQKQNKTKINSRVGYEPP